MDFCKSFISASHEYTTLEKHIPSPYFRRRFSLTEIPSSAFLNICGLGFYELYVNGHRITHSALAPFISNPDHLLYYDNYDIKPLLHEGDNIIGIQLGNGWLNYVGGRHWDLDKAAYRSAPMVACRIELRMSNGQILYIDTDSQYKTAPSPLLFDDFRYGEYYDARKELPNWTNSDFDDDSWTSAFSIQSPRGDAVLNTADPILSFKELSAISITPQQGGFLYDFGENTSGIARLTIRGTAGQKIDMVFGEWLGNDGQLRMDTIGYTHLNEVDLVQRCTYVCHGNGTEQYQPTFTYFGFRYILISGITAEQASQQALIAIVQYTALEERGGFVCSSNTANQIQEMTRRSSLTNFHHILTDCPHREKNGWTADIALSAEHMLLNLSPENNFKQWLHSVRKAMNEQGALPGIVPTAGFGYNWGNGPAWDAALIQVPYDIYMYREDFSVIEENADAILRYITYLSNQRDEKGLISFGLGDWCPSGKGCDEFTAPVIFTDTVISMDLCSKAAYLFEQIHRPLYQNFAYELSQQLRNSARIHLLNTDTMTAIGNCQTTQAMSLHYGLWLYEEIPAAVNQLLSLVEQADRKMDVGVLGGRVLFHALAEHGHADLAWEMIVTPDFPSYGNWVSRGATTLWEDFHQNDKRPNSMNHHFWGDVSHWFIRRVAGINYSAPKHCLEVRPNFIKTLTYAQGYHLTAHGEISVRWERQNNLILLDVKKPDEIFCTIHLPKNFSFQDGQTSQICSTDKSWILLCTN